MEQNKLVFVLLGGWIIWFAACAITLCTQGKSIIYPSILTSSYLEGVFLLREDLDFCFWGGLKFIWLPYQHFMKKPSKMPIVNIALQLAYLLVIIILFQLLLFGLFSLPNSGNKPVSNYIISFFVNMRSHPLELIVWLGGVIVGNYVGKMNSQQSMFTMLVKTK